jgi:hypothetical protein
MDYRKTAREIVERALRATVRGFDQEAFANWERAPLGDFLNASQLPGFLDRLVRGLSERGADSNRLQFFQQLGSIPLLLRSPSSVVVDFAEVFLEPFDLRFQKMMRGEAVKPPQLPPELEEAMFRHTRMLSPLLRPGLSDNLARMAKSLSSPLLLSSCYSCGRARSMTGFK